MTYPTRAEVLAAYAETNSIRAAARALRVSYGYVQKRIGTQAPKTAPEDVAPIKPGVHLFTCEQNDTPLHMPFWRNLMAYAHALGATIHVSRFTYDTGAHGERSVKAGKAKAHAEVRFSPHTEPFADTTQLAVAPNLMWCAELNLSPSAVAPLSGLMTYTRGASAIIPHVKLALESAPSITPTPRFVMTTGTITLPNYIAKKAGQVAEFHHVVGALLVDVAKNGSWVARHINAEPDGAFQDLRTRVTGGEVRLGEGDVEALVLGDLHAEQIDPEARADAVDWLCRLKPRHIVLHDTLDWLSRNHHRRNDPHETFRLHKAGYSSVTRDIQEAGQMLALLASNAPKATIHCVESNHDEAFYKWLREVDYRSDPENALLHLRAATDVYERLGRGDTLLPPLQAALRAINRNPPAVNHVGAGDSLLLAGVECGLHGHYGPNGARGSAQAFRGVGRRLVVGHTHVARIVDGVYCVGLTGKLRMGYNRGPSSWSHTHCVIYANGKRALLLPRVQPERKA